MNIKEYIKNKRSTLSKSSIDTYNSILVNLYKSVFDKDEINTDDFNDSKKILKHLDTLPNNKRKTILSALVVITDNDDYRKQMLKDIDDFNTDINKQEKTETQKNNWIDTLDINELYSDLKKTAQALYRLKHLSPSDYQLIQNYVIISLLGGIYIPPRRSKDYIDFKIKNINTETDNYLKGKKLYFSSYKTSKTYGLQVIDIPTQLHTILKKWISINPTEYLFFDSKMNRLTNVKLNQRINKLFNNKKVGVNSFRHAFLTDKYKNLSDKLDEMDSDFKKMGSSRSQFKTYVKND